MDPATLKAAVGAITHSSVNLDVGLDIEV